MAEETKEAPGSYLRALLFFAKEKKQKKVWGAQSGRVARDAESGARSRGRLVQCTYGGRLGECAVRSQQDMLFHLYSFIDELCGKNGIRLA